MADDILALVKEFDHSLELKYNKFYIGLAKNGQPNNTVTMRPKRGFIRFEPRLMLSTEIQDRIESAGLDVMKHDNKWRRFRIRLKPGDVSKHKAILSELIKEAFDAQPGS